MLPSPEELDALMRENEALREELSSLRQAIDKRLHDLRNPLTATLSALIALTTPALTLSEPQRLELLDSALSGARRLEALLKKVP